MPAAGRATVVAPLARPAAPGGQAGVIGRSIDPPSGSGELVRRVLLGVLAVAVLVGVGVGAFLLAGGSDDGDETVTPATTGDDDEQVPDDTDPDETDPESTTVTEDPAAPEEIVIGDRLAVTFPADWAVTEPGEDDAATAQELFPDDAAAAAVFDQNLSQQAEGSLLFGADRGSFDGGVLTSVVASFVTYGDGAGFESVASQARPSLESGGGVVEREEAITVGEAEALRVNYRVPTPGREFTGLQVIVDAGDGAFVLTFQTDVAGDDAPVVDEIVASLAIR